MHRIFLLWFAIGVYATTTRADLIDFDAQIRPILSDKCYPCHGPDEATREASLRLDTREGAVGQPGDYAAFIAGDVASSEGIRRVESDDPDQQMPPPKSKLSLTDAEKQVLRRWVEQGATWSQHWSFVRPSRPAVPSDSSRWSLGPIDRFIAARAHQSGLQLNEEAGKETLIRRVTLDLTGLPPTPAEVQAFLADDSRHAYEKVVDRLLASPHYGQRMAWPWLDASRYADTDGFQGDPTRTMYPWRDWLVDTLNGNMPFDQFTIEMLAGDLLDDPTAEQILATGFNRNHMFNGEGGRIAEETRVENVFDRAETTGTIWLGLTMTCCRCHDHKYDPISQKEYFQFYAFFNNTSETGRSGRGKTPPVLKYLAPAERERLKDANAELRRIEAAISDESSSFDPEQAEQKKRRLEKRIEHLNKRARTVMVMDDLPESKRRQTVVLQRGGYDKPTEIEVRTGIPEVLPPLPNDRRHDRLALARWLVDPNHPLTARVTVNRYWQLFFGRGLVKSTEDFGSQGDRPTHPELLDYLALEFIESGWDVKRLHRRIVTSATYRQSAKATESDLENDFENIYFARSPRYRLPSWMLRDQALAASGLLVDQFGGPGVKPYQPEGIWSEATFGKIKYQGDSGDKLYRRSLYVFWRRIVGPTMFFDGSKRQTCDVKPARTNTPLHALTTLNETLFVEAARKMAAKVIDAADETDDRLKHAFHLTTSRSPDATELRVLRDRVNQLRADFTAHPQDAEALLSVGDSETVGISDRGKIDRGEHAAYTVVCSILLNLDETLSKP